MTIETQLYNSVLSNGKCDDVLFHIVGMRYNVYVHFKIGLLGPCPPNCVDVKRLTSVPPLSTC